MNRNQRDRVAEVCALRQHHENPSLMDRGAHTALGDLLPHAFAYESYTRGRSFMRAVATQAADEISAACFLIEQGQIDNETLSRVLAQVGSRLEIAAELDRRFEAANPVQTEAPTESAGETEAEPADQEVPS